MSKYNIKFSKNIGQFDHFLALKGVLEQTKRRVHGFF